MMTPEQLEKAGRLNHELLELQTARTAVELAIKVTVAEMRSIGASWSWIGSSLGVSTQTAWERYGSQGAARSGASFDQQTLL